MATHCSILAWEIPWTEEPGAAGPPGEGTLRAVPTPGSEPPTWALAPHSVTCSARLPVCPPAGAESQGRVTSSPSKPGREVVGSPGQGRRPRGLGCARSAGKPGEAPGTLGLPTGPITANGAILPLGLWASQTTPLPLIFQEGSENPTRGEAGWRAEVRGHPRPPAAPPL